MSPILKITLILSLSLLILAGAAVGVVFGVANSEAGTRWLLARAALWTDGDIELQGVGGSLLGLLQVQTMRISQPGLTIEIQSLRLEWKPADLFQGLLHIDGVSAEHVRIVRTATESSTTEQLFDPAALELPMDVSFTAIRIRDLQLVEGNQPAQLVSELRLDGQLINDELTIEQLTIELAQGELKLSGTTALVNPMPLDLQVAWHWRLPSSDNQQAISSTIDIPLEGTLALEGSLVWSKALELQLQYHASVKGVEKLNPELPALVDLSGSLDGLYLDDTLTFKSLSMALADTILDLQGTLSLAGNTEPTFDVVLQWVGLQWPLVSSVPDVSSAQGKLLLRGNFSDYHLKMQTHINLEQLTGTLMGYAFQLDAQASLTDEEMQLDNLLLEGQGNQFSANGLLSEDLLALDWVLRVPAPGALYPGVSGVITGRGKVVGSPDTPRVQAQLEGIALQWETFSIATLNVALAAGLAPDDTLSMDVTSGPIEDGGQPLFKSLAFQAEGTTSDHSLSIALTTVREQLSARLEGGLNQPFDTWQGRLAQVHGQSEEYGGWNLSRASALSLAADAVTLANTCLKNDTSATQLCAQVDWNRSGMSTLKAELQALPVEMLNPVMTGVIEGKMEVGLAAEGAIFSKASLRMTPGLVKVELDRGSKQLSHGGGNFELNVGSKGLNATLDFAAPEQGQVQATLLLPAFRTWPPADEQPLGGRLLASLPDLSGAPAWVPELANSAGQFEADVQLAGTLERPEFLGTFALTNGAADIPMAGLQLRQIELLALSNASRAELLDVTGGMVSGPGRLDLAGQINITDRTLTLALKGERLQAYNTPDAQVLLSPKLNIAWSDEILKLRGEVLIPKADITPKLEIGPSMLSENPDLAETTGEIIGHSRDVVIVNAAEIETRKKAQHVVPLRIDSQVQLILGDEVHINTLGLISQITGAVTFTNTPDQAELIPIAKGRLSLDDGTFRAFGQDLVIETGQIIFPNTPATEPELNIRAVRWIDNDPAVTAAGVLVTGSVTDPILDLFSRPQLEPSEVQSYLLTGRSSADKSNVLSIGTYVSPRIYVGYGYNLIQDTSEFNSLFNITPRYGISTNVGEADNNINMTFTYEN